MKFYFHASEKILLRKRNEIFISHGLENLYKNGFNKSPYFGSWFGKNNLGDYSYELCRLSNKSILEIITVHISKGDEWIKIFLNIFQINPVINKLNFLENIDGIKFHLPPNSISQMRLDDVNNNNEYNNQILSNKKYKIGFYLTQKQFENKLSNLGAIIDNDLKNIDYFSIKWHKMNNIRMVKWNGEIE